MAFTRCTYREIIDSLSSLEALLLSGGLKGDELNRLRTHASHVGEIEAARVAGSTEAIDRDQTLWSLVEATEFADIYRGMSTYDPTRLADKFKLILKGPDHPIRETESTNLARNTAFELNVASRLRSRGFTISLPHNPDVLCQVEGASVFLQCKRPFSDRGIPRNIDRARGQLVRDLDAARDPNARGVIAISASRALNSGERLYRASTAAMVCDGLAREVRALAEPPPWRLIKDRRIIGSVFHIITPSVVEELGNLISAAQEMVVYPAPWASEPDRDLLRRLFMLD